MQRRALLYATGALLALPAFAQQRLDPARMHPITAPIRHAGTVDVTTGRWTRSAAATKGLPTQTIYDNTCSWTGGPSYAGFDWCEENYDEGRVPGPTAPNAPPTGAEFQQSILSVEVSYCTFAGPLQVAGGYDMDVAFWD